VLSEAGIASLEGFSLGDFPGGEATKNVAAAAETGRSPFGRGGSVLTRDIERGKCLDAGQG
jgi:hypothetical protein